MLCRIQTLDFFLSTDTKPHRRPDHKKCDGNQKGSPGRYRDKSSQLQSQLGKASTIENSFLNAGRGKSRRRRRGKQTDCNCSPYAVHHMNRNSPHRVVHMNDMVAEPYPEYHQQTCYRANDESSRTVCHITGCSDGHQPRQRGVQAHRNIRFAIFQPCKYHAYHRSCRWRYRCGQKDGSQCGKILCSSTIESVPAKPEDKYAKCTNGQIMSWYRIHLLYISLFIPFKFTDSGTQHSGANQCADTAHHMYRTGTGIIVKTQFG